MNKIYQLPYDDVEDKDIHEWLNSFSRNKKAEMVRHAIRYYMSYHGEKRFPVIIPPGEVEKNEKEGAPKKRGKTIMFE